MGLSSLGGNEWIHMEDNIKRAFALLGFVLGHFGCALYALQPHPTAKSRYKFRDDVSVTGATSLAVQCKVGHISLSPKGFFWIDGPIELEN